MSTAKKIFFEVWVTDANSETWRIDDGRINVVGGLR